MLLILLEDLKEVKEVSDIIAKLGYSLVLFNETFQTTAFDEAAAAIYDILDIISRSEHQVGVCDTDPALGTVSSAPSNVFVYADEFQ